MAQRMVLKQQKVDELLALFKKQHPNWSSFSDPIDSDFQEDEIDYKQRLVIKAKSQLSEPDLRQLIDSENYDGLIARLRALGQDKDNNLLFLKYPVSSDLRILSEPNLDKKSFCKAIYDLLYGNGETEARLSRYLEWIEDDNLPNKWTFPTYFLFLCHPDTEIFIKPTAIKTFLDSIAEGNIFTSKPSAEGYAAIRQIAYQLRNAFQPYKPRDMVDIQSFIWECVSALKQQPCYWKIAHGENARQWKECLDQGFIAIGWDELGDISSLSSKEFYKHRDELIIQNPEWKWKKTAVNQVHIFAQIKPGDYIVANRGKTEILGIGTVTGNYYFDSDAPKYKHRLPVDWYDLTPKQVNQPNWQRTLVALTPEQFSELFGEESPHPKNNLFSPKTFDLLLKWQDKLGNDFFLHHQDELCEYVQEPFDQLLRLIETFPPLEITTQSEKVNWGPASLEGRFSFHGFLFIKITCDGLEFGFQISNSSSQASEDFKLLLQRNYQKYQELLSQIRNRCGSSPISTISAESILQNSDQQLVECVFDKFKRVYPFVLLATLENPKQAILDYFDYIEPSPPPSPNPEFTLIDCTKVTYLDESLLSDWVEAIKRKKQAVLYGPPGTGKTFLARHLAKHLIGGGSGFVDTVQFHPAYTYEDFIEGIRPQVGGSGLEYPHVPGRLLEFCEKAEQRRKEPCILIVDEINRANLAQVFGELMYLLEYRNEEMKLASGRKFRIPDNVRIIGTMNTADRSIALVDHALRRRFAFLYVQPNYEGLRKFHQSTALSSNLVDLLKAINSQIDDPHYQIGTSFFLRPTLDTELRSIWQLEIEPYLEEFFFDQPDKMKTLKWEQVKGRLHL